MSQFKLQAGDVVCLKSGGPRMTIREVGEGGYHCQWFDTDNYGRVCEAIFPGTSVKKAESAPTVTERPYYPTGTYRSYAP